MDYCKSDITEYVAMIIDEAEAEAQGSSGTSHLTENLLTAAATWSSV